MLSCSNLVSKILINNNLLAPAPPMDRGVSDVPPSYAFGSNYESGRGGGPMRGGPMRGGPMRGEPMRG